jgi:alkyldihydroxyacetonephosphate synthase
MPVSCRFTHVYPDGPALYFTVVAGTGAQGGAADAWARWREIKAACNAAVVRHGGTSTHHHAVGRDHRSAYEAEVPALARAALAAAKAAFDPQGLMNPGVLLEPQGRRVGIRGGTVG